MAAPVVAFTIAADVPAEAQGAVIAAVRSVDGVVDAYRLSPESSIPEVRRMCAAALANGADPRAVAARVRGVPGVESADVPPARGI
ncbi:MAG TPA: hypothetical protein VLJ59_08225 [Mycobacteriales bacterium]|nr:hypothetical protein [Mycobacteriales bacterium]